MLFEDNLIKGHIHKKTNGRDHTLMVPVPHAPRLRKGKAREFDEKLRGLNELNIEDELTWLVQINKELLKETAQLKVQISEKEQAIINVRSDFDELKQSVVALTSALKIAKQKIRKYEDARSAFLANISHELRTPMNTAMGFSHLLSQTGLSKRQAEYVESINLSTEELLAIVEDLHDLSQTVNGHLNFQSTPFSLKDAVEKVMQEITEHHKREHKVIVSFDLDDDLPAMVLGDEKRLRQVLLHLLKNGIKFTECGTVHLSVGQCKREGDGVIIDFKVSDSGVGIPGKKIKTIFDSYILGGSETGLGLAIVKQLVELQGGEVRVSSEVNKGSVFAFWLPFDRIDRGIHSDGGYPVGYPMGGSSFLSDTRILMVEDNYLNQIVLKNLLEDFNGSVYTVSNGKDAIEELEKNEYDIVFMDIQMPVMDGYQATRHIRSSLNSKARDIVIVGMTAHARKGERERCLHAGIDECVIKPLNPALLHFIANKYLREINR